MTFTKSIILCLGANLCGSIPFAAQLLQSLFHIFLHEELLHNHETKGVICFFVKRVTHFSEWFQYGFIRGAYLYLLVMETIISKLGVLPTAAFPLQFGILCLLRDVLVIPQGFIWIPKWTNTVLYCDTFSALELPTRMEDEATISRPATLRTVYAPRLLPISFSGNEGTTCTYPQLLRMLCSINDSLKRDGILAPTDVSLVNTARLYELIGKPLDKIPTVIVGGTNGKVRLGVLNLTENDIVITQGSTCFKIANALTSSGIRTGLFVSPHISSFRERMQIDNILISEEYVVSLLPRLTQVCIENNIAATQFEITFLLACLYYEAADCEAVVLEVG
jgi:hypothetical protein